MLPSLFRSIQIYPGLVLLGMFFFQHGMGWGRSRERSVRKLDLLYLCFSLNFYFPYVSFQFPSMFSLLTYSHSFFSLSADYSRHSR